jgi:hypothetical protein
MSLQDLVNRALDERRDADYRRARADSWLAATIGEAERLRAAGSPVRELASDQRLGAIRLDGANLPAQPVIEKTDELASWLAETSPDLVTASITVPVGKLEEVLELLEMTGLRDAAEAKVAPKDLAQTLAWLEEHCKVQADPDTPHAWNVMHQDDEGHLTAVPGVTARPPTPTWKVILDRTLKAEAVTVAKAEVGELVRELREQDVGDASRDADGYTVGSGHEEWCVDAEHDPDGTSCYPAAMDADGRPATPDAAAVLLELRERSAPPQGPLEKFAELVERPEGVEYVGRTVAQLRALCRDRALSASGTKAELVDRLIVADRNLSRPGWTARV